MTFKFKPASPEELEQRVRASAPAPAKPTARVRARNTKGQLVGDDPSTPENEAWVEKPAKE
jgi:hypothetical protein